jgi:hypothetical protein
MTTVRTAKTKYTVEALSFPQSGPAALVVRAPAGKMRRLTVKDVGRARFQAAVTHFLREAKDKAEAK